MGTCTEDRTPTAPPSLSAVTEATITHTLLTSGHDVNNVKIYTTASITPAPGALVTVAVLTHQSSSAAPAPTLTGGGMTAWDLVATVAYNGATPLDRVSIFRAMSASPGSGPITITSSVTVSNCQWIVSQWDGIETGGTNGAGAIVQTGSATGAAVNGLTVTLASFASPSNAAYGVFGIASNTAVAAAGTGFTRIDEQPSGESTTGDLFAEWAVNDNTIDATWSNKSGGALGVEIKAAGGGGGGGVSASQSTVTASPSSITAGSGTSTITVTAKDANGNPVSGATVVLSATGSGNTLTQPSGPTNAQGVATGTLSSTVVEAKTVSATANGVAITQNASVTVTPAGSGGAITHTLLTAGTNTTNQNVYTTDTIAPAANTLITVAVLGRRSTGAQTPTITGGGITSWTLVASVSYDAISTPLSQVSVFRAMSSAPGRGPLTIAFPNSQSNATWIVSQWVGVDTSGTNGAGAIVQSTSARGDAVSALSATLSAFVDPSDVAYGVVGVGMNGPAVTPGTGFTEIAEPTSGESNLLEAAWGLNLRNVSASWTPAKNAGLVAVELKVAPSATQDTTRPAMPGQLNLPQDSTFVVGSPDDTMQLYYRNIAGILFDDTTGGATIRAVIAKYNGTIIGSSSAFGSYIVQVPDPGTSYTAFDSLLNRIDLESGVDLAYGLSYRTAEGFRYRYPNDGRGSRKVNWGNPDSITNATRSRLAVRAPLAWGCETGTYAHDRVSIGVIDQLFPAHGDIIATRFEPNQPLRPRTSPVRRSHGIAVAGIMAATGNNNAGIAGMVWGADLHLLATGRNDSVVPDLVDRWGVLLDSARIWGLRVVVSSNPMGVPADTHAVRLIRMALRRYLTAGNGNVFVYAISESGQRYSLQAIASGQIHSPLYATDIAVAQLFDSLPGQLVVVAGTDDRGVLWNTSDVWDGATFVAAPATNVLSLANPADYPDSTAHIGDGTSLSAPFVAGVAAQLLSMYPGLSGRQVTDYIYRGSRLPRLNPQTGQPEARQPVSPTTPDVYQLDAYGALTLLASEQPGVPLCGNRAWVANLTLLAERTSAYAEPLVHLNADATLTHVLHGGRRIEVFGSAFLAYAYQPSGSWVQTDSAATSPDGGTFLSVLQKSHDGDSAVVWMSGGGFFPIGIERFTDSLVTLLRTVPSSGTTSNTTSICISQSTSGVCNGFAWTGIDVGIFILTLAYSPLGDEIAAIVSSVAQQSTGVSDWGQCPNSAPGQCRSVTYLERPDSTVVHLIRIRDGTEVHWGIQGKEVWWAAISEDGAQIAQGEPVEGSTWTQQGTGSGAATVNYQEQYPECDIVYRAYRTGAVLDSLPIANDLGGATACGDLGRGTIAPVLMHPTLLVPGQPIVIHP